MTGTVHPEFAAHGSFAHLKLGRLAKRDDARTVQLAKFLDDAVVLPTIPDEYDFAAAVGSWPMYGNDRLGDCTCAAVGHMIQAWTAAAGSPATPADDVIEKLYIPETGTDDTGRVELDVLNYWRQTGTDDGHKIVGYAAVDPQNLDHVHAAGYLFGGVYAGAALPRTAQGQPEWDVVGDPTDSSGPAYPGSWGGHAIPYLASSRLTKKVKVVTWGGVLLATYDWETTYTDELYAIITVDFLRSGQSPAGLDLAALQADIAAVTAS